MPKVLASFDTHDHPGQKHSCAEINNVMYVRSTFVFLQNPTSPPVLRYCQEDIFKIESSTLSYATFDKQLKFYAHRPND